MTRRGWAGRCGRRMRWGGRLRLQRGGGAAGGVHRGLEGDQAQADHNCLINLVHRGLVQLANVLL